MSTKTAETKPDQAPAEPTADDLRGDPASMQNRIEMNDPHLSGSEAVEQALARQAQS